MTKFSVDLRTKIISDDTSVYFARAGAKGHNFSQVWQQQAIGPDLPGLGLDISQGLSKDANLIAKINRSRRISRWCSTPRNRRDPVRPTMNLASYSNDKRRSGHHQVEAVVNAYFKEMKAGDVLVIPSPSIMGDAIVAELLPLGDKPISIPGVGRYDGFSFDARSFGHFRTVPMVDIPRHIIEISRKPGAFAELRDRKIRDRIFELCFDDFSLDDVFLSKISTSKPDFRPFDANVLNAFVQMVAQNVAILEEGESGKKLIGLSEAAFRVALDDSLEVKIDISSPGHLSMIARSLTPLVAATLFSICVSAGFDASVLAQPGLEISVENSKIDKALDVCSEPVSKFTQDMLKFLPESTFQEMCDLLRQTVEKTGASPSVSSKIE